MTRAQHYLDCFFFSLTIACCLAIYAMMGMIR